MSYIKNSLPDYLFNSNINFQVELKKYLKQKKSEANHDKKILKSDDKKIFKLK